MTKKIILLLLLFVSFAFAQTSAFAAGQYDKDRYVDNVQKKVQSNWFPPTCTINESVAVLVTLNHDGNISNLKLLSGSKDNDFDKSVIRAINGVGSFGPLGDNQNELKVYCYFSPLIVTAAASISPKAMYYNKSNIVNVANRTSGYDFAGYAVNMQNKINSNWNPKTLKKHRDAIVLVTVDKDGTVGDIKIQKSSNKKKFNAEIVDAVMRSVPFDSLPSSVVADHKNVQIKFSYDKTQDRTVITKDVVAFINSQEDSDRYINQVESIISKRFGNKSCFCKKDVLLEMNIDKSGKLTYVKLKNQSDNDNFIRTEFNRKALFTLQKTSFPPIPDQMGVNNVTVNYRLVTQRNRLFRNFVNDYVLNGFRTNIQGFCVQIPDSL